PMYRSPTPPARPSSPTRTLFRSLPPELASGPDRSRVGANDGSAHGSQRPVHIRVRVRSNYKRSRYRITALDHDLVSNSRACWVKVHTVLFYPAGSGIEIGRAHV